MKDNVVIREKKKKKKKSEMSDVEHFSRSIIPLMVVPAEKQVKLLLQILLKKEKTISTNILLRKIMFENKIQLNIMTDR